MSASLRRAVLTGMGLVTPLGLGRPALGDALRQGRSAVRPIRSFDASALPVRIAAAIAGFDARDYLERKDRKSLKIMPRAIQLAVAAARLAVQDAGLSAGLDPERFGVVLGSGTIPSEMTDLGPAAQACLDPASGRINMAAWGLQGLPRIPPMWMLSHVPNMPACHVSILHNAQGPCNSVTQTELGGLLALGEAWRLLVRDRGDVFLVGGADTRLTPVSMVRQCLYGELSRRNEAPAKACRPFDRGRDGVVVGEGGAVLVLEEREHARRRGAAVLAEVVGFAAGFDRDGDGRGLARVIRLALERAGLRPDDIDHVNAHGDGRVAGDIWEARGLHALFGAVRPAVPVLAAKSAFGS